MIRLALLAVFVAGCGGQPEYSLEIVFPPGADLSEAVRFEVDVVRDGCDLVPPGGEMIGPSEVVRPLGWRWGEETSDVGDLVPGRYGFAARVRREDCTVPFSGCAPTGIEEDGSGSIVIDVAAVDGPGCIVTQSCEGADGCVEIVP